MLGGDSVGATSGLPSAGASGDCLGASLLLPLGGAEGLSTESGDDRVEDNMAECTLMTLRDRMKIVDK